MKITKDTLAELRGNIVDTIEDFCNKHDIEIENPEMEEHNKKAECDSRKNDVKIFGDDYDAIADTAEANLKCPGNIPALVIKEFENILKARGSVKALNDVEKHALTISIISTLKKWDIISLAMYSNHS